MWKALSFTVLGFVLGVVTSNFAATIGVTQQSTITIFNPLSLVFNPPNPMVPCNASPGAQIAMATVGGGDGNPISWGTSGDIGDFVLGTPSGSSVPIRVSPSGIAAAHCPVAPALTSTQNFSVTANQP